jgi:hypothetical protein
MEDVTLEQLLRQYVQLPSVPSGTGWYPVLHVCDHGKKGPRAGFKFDGDTVAFHCFNCGLAAVYDPKHRGREGQPLISKKMRQILEDFNIPQDEWQQVLFSALKDRDAGPMAATSSKPVQSIEPIEVPLPETFYPLSEADPEDKWAMIARYYLEERSIDPSSYPFMLSRRTDVPHLKKWFGRVIMPIYKDGKLIYYTGRDLTGKALKKYESPAISRDRVIYGFDKLFEDNDLPLYIVEGWFDAFVIDGVAIFGNEFSSTKIKWLNRSRRQKVYIPDQFGDGFRAAKQAIDAGWSISTPDFGDCKDVSAAVQKYGKLYVLRTLAQHTASGFEAELNARMYCKQ